MSGSRPLSTAEPSIPWRLAVSGCEYLRYDISAPFRYAYAMADVTTIKVPQALRERISHEAFQRGVTAASLIGELLDRYERDQRFVAVREAYAAGTDAGYAEDLAAWDEVTADGLPA